MVDSRHRGNIAHQRRHRVPARRRRAFHRHPDQRPRPVRQHAAQDDGGLPGQRLHDAPVAARGGGAPGGCRIRPARAADRDPDGGGAAGRTADHLPGRGRLLGPGRRCRHGDRLHHRLEPARLQSRADLGDAVLRPRLRVLAHFGRGAAAVPRRGARARSAALHCEPTRQGCASMIFIIVNVLLWVLVAALGLTAAVRSKALFREGAAEGVRDFVVLLPRIMIGVVGSGYIAAIMPEDLITSWIGPKTGLLGIAIATLAGAITPGGAVVGFSVGAAALKGGGGAPQVIAYSTAWSLYALTRLMNWEIAMMPPRVVWLRALVSIPLPFLAGAGAMLIGHP